MDIGSAAECDENALEHTPEGGKIWIEIKDTVLYVQMSVIDSGPGIPKEDIPIF